MTLIILFLILDIRILFLNIKILNTKLKDLDYIYFYESFGVQFSGARVNLSEKRMKSIIDLWKKDKKEFLPDEFDELLAEVSITNEF